ncbi:Inhibitor of growth protein 3 [Myotis brandtii]|uniref:Inhibitor of growth protein 3 n=1 Tax=Myotis brandtii TaxID=109478 RepID=S7QEU2_MYOBR|nr:Inhibitor of growth protein 3 [Myotis brandtii]
MDLRDRFTEMREMDLQVQNAMDQLEQRVSEFFMNAKKNKPEWREEQMASIKKDYYKALEDADEKVQLANQIYDLVDRHLRKLDQELAKFKMELEADNAGITEILERRSLELDTPSQPVNNHHAHSHTPVEKRKYNPTSHHTTTDHIPEKKFKSEALLSTLTSDASKENTLGCRNNNSTASSNNAYNVNSSQPLASYNIGSLSSGTGAGAITMAAAQAVQATAQGNSWLFIIFSAHDYIDTECQFISSRFTEWEKEQVSYGEMVGCDNQDCPIEWFHYGCVGLTEAPKGKWYCPQCTAAMKRRGSRHK